MSCYDEKCTFIHVIGGERYVEMHCDPILIYFDSKDKPQLVQKCSNFFFKYLFEIFMFFILNLQYLLHRCKSISFPMFLFHNGKYGLLKSFII